MFACQSLALLALACGGGGGSVTGPPPPAATPEWFFVENFSGNVSGFSASSGKLAPIPGSSAMFPFALTNFAVKPDGTFLAAITTTAQLAASFQIANIASGGGHIRAIPDVDTDHTEWNRHFIQRDAGGR